MPSWPMAMPSVTVMVQNSRGVAPAALTPSLTAWAWRIRAVLQGAASFQQEATPTNGWAISRVPEPHGVVVGAVRRARRPLGHVPAGQLGLVPGSVGFLGHGVSSV